MLTLVNAPLDLQITICIFLHPSDILTLRKTCKALELVTRKRIVWIAVLHRVCLDNTLFLPSFPIPDMSDLELERAALGPRRWIKLCGASQKQRSNGKRLRPRTTRNIIKDVEKLVIVPGGRYLVTGGHDICVWDLGYVSTVDCKLVASIEMEDDTSSCGVQATPDGEGLVILSLSPYHLIVFEICLQSEIPLLTQIADLDWFSFEVESEPLKLKVHLLPDTLICCAFHEDRIIFRVLNYRTNHSTSFSADVKNTSSYPGVKTFATKTAIIVFYEEGLLIWAIPPLSPQLSDLLDHFYDSNPTYISPLFKIPFPDGTNILGWRILSSWYSGSEPVYFDILYSDDKLGRFKIIIKPDLSDASLQLLKKQNITSDDLTKTFQEHYNEFQGYAICEDALVYIWINDSKTWGASAGSISAPFTNVVTRWKGCVDDLCPASGRFVHKVKGKKYNSGGRIVVVDLF